MAPALLAAIPALIQAGSSLLNGANQKKEAAQVSTPVSRRMESVQSDPSSVLQQGRAALGNMDQSTQQALSPVIEEALKKAAMQRQQQQGGTGVGTSY